MIKNIFFFRSTFKDNIYQYSNLILPENENEVTIRLDVSKTVFKTLVAILRKGNLEYNLNKKEEKTRKRFYK